MVYANLDKAKVIEACERYLAEFPQRMAREKADYAMKYVGEKFFRLFDTGRTAEEAEEMWETGRVTIGKGTSLSRGAMIFSEAVLSAVGTPRTPSQPGPERPRPVKDIAFEKHRVLYQAVCAALTEARNTHGPSVKMSKEQMGLISPIL